MPVPDDKAWVTFSLATFGATTLSLACLPRRAWASGVSLRARGRRQPSTAFGLVMAGERPARPAEGYWQPTKLTDEAKRVATACQDLLFASTGAAFVKARFQAPRSATEALQVMRSPVEDKERGTSTEKVHLLGWAHTQMLSADMAAIGYRVQNVTIHRVVKQQKPPAVEDWLVVQVPKRRKSKSPGRGVAKRPQVKEEGGAGVLPPSVAEGDGRARSPAAGMNGAKTEADKVQSPIGVSKKVAATEAGAETAGETAGTPGTPTKTRAITRAQHSASKPKLRDFIDLT